MAHNRPERHLDWPGPGVTGLHCGGAGGVSLFAYPVGQRYYMYLRSAQVATKASVSACLINRSFFTYTTLLFLGLFVQSPVRSTGKYVLFLELLTPSHVVALALRQWCCSFRPAKPLHPLFLNPPSPDAVPLPPPPFPSPFPSGINHPRSVQTLRKSP